MFDMAKGLKDINDVAIRNTAVIELTEKIMAAQSQQAALIERVGELEKEVAGFKTWESQKQRYQLTDFGGGTFAYLLKVGMEDGEPSHRLCAHCYQQGHPSILQFRFRNNYGQDTYACSSCKTEFNFGPRVNPPRPTRAVTKSHWMR